MIDWKYSVLLHRHLAEADLAFFEVFCGRVTSPDGSYMPHFFCSEVDVSHHVYIAITVSKPSEGSVHKIRIPHNFVFLISDPLESARPIGFVTESHL
jgi:hypothetical protein